MFKPIQLAAGTLVASAYSTMVLGAYVKAIGAGMACAEWGTCNGGQVFPLDSVGVAAEVAHRIAATVVIAVGALLLALELLQYRAERRLIALTLLAALTLAVQVSLGAFTIYTNLQPLIVTLHLAVATFFFALALVVALRVWKLAPPNTLAPTGSPGPEADGSKPGGSEDAA